MKNDNITNKTYYEDAEAGCWRINVANGNTAYKNFGEIVLETINLSRSCKDESVFRRNYIAMADRGDLSFPEGADPEQMIDIFTKNYQENAKEIDFLFEILQKTDEIKRNNDREAQIAVWDNCKDLYFLTNLIDSLEYKHLSDDEKEMFRLQCIRPCGSKLLWTGEKYIIAPAYRAVDERCLFAEDLRHMLFDKDVPPARVCPRCGNLFLSRRGKYCRECKSEGRTVAYDKFKTSGSPRILHKKIYDMISKRGDDFHAFVDESNYYWDRVTQSIPENPIYTEPIQTIDDYAAWLQRTHESLKKRRKKSE